MSITPASKAKSQVLADNGNGQYVLKNALDFNVGDVVVLEGPGGEEYGMVSAVEGSNVTMAKPFAGEVVDTALLPKITVRTCEVNIELRCEDAAETYENVSFNITTPYLSRS